MNVHDDPVLRQVAAADPVADVDEQAYAGPAAAQLREQILAAKSTPPRGSRRMRRSAVGAAGVAGLLVVGGVAAAAGLVPSGVTRYFQTVSPRGSSISHERMLVEHVSPGGIRDQVWVARNSAGERCQEVRTVSADGRVEDASVGCGTSGLGVPAPPVERLSAGQDAAGRPWPPLTYDVIARTTLRDADRLEIDYPNGRHFALSFNRRTGWAIGVVPPSVANTTMRSVVLVRSRTGAVIARRTLPATTGR